MKRDDQAIRHLDFAEPFRDINDQDGRQEELPLLALTDDLSDSHAPSGVAQPLVAVKKKPNVLRLFMLTDSAALLSSFVIAWQISAFINAYFLGRTNLETPSETNLVLVLQFVFLSVGVLLWFMRGYHYQMRMPFWTETRKIVSAVACAALINSFLQVVSKEDFSRIWLLSAWMISGVGMIAFRTLGRRVLRRMNAWLVPALIVGKGRSVAEARKNMGHESNLGFDFVAQIRDLPISFRQAGFSWANLCAAHKAEHVVIALDAEQFKDAEYPLAQLLRERVSFSVIPPTYPLSFVGMSPQVFVGQDMMVMVRMDGLDNPLARIFKRSFDIISTFCGLIVLAPVIATLALIVKLDGGPAFYRHKRLGLGGKTFSCYKLRSMMPNGAEVLTKYLESNPAARAEWQNDHKLRNDPRVTMIGAFMRCTSLDELPQLFNVLRGDMSVVGPRPIIVAETTKYDNDIAYYYRVRPGITGLWQVSGRNDVTYAERVHMDSWYVRNWSVWYDLVILCKTVAVVLKGRGAY